jgi:hypothetical protein
MQLIHHSRAHLHQSMPMPQQLPQIPILGVRYPDAQKAVLHSNRNNSCASCRSVFCLRTRLV